MTALQYRGDDAPPRQPWRWRCALASGDVGLCGVASGDARLRLQMWGRIWRCALAMCASNRGPACQPAQPARNVPAEEQFEAPKAMCSTDACRSANAFSGLGCGYCWAGESLRPHRSGHSLSLEREWHSLPCESLSLGHLSLEIKCCLCICRCGQCSSVAAVNLRGTCM